MQRIADRNYWVHLLSGFKGGIPQKVTPVYPWVLHQKIDFVRQAIRDNPFGSEYFAWFDAGTGHGNLNLPKHWCPCNIATRGLVTMVYDTHKSVNQAGTGQPYIDLAGLTLERYEKEDYKTRTMTNPIGSFWGGR